MPSLKVKDVLAALASLDPEMPIFVYGGNYHDVLVPLGRIEEETVCMVSTGPGGRIVGPEYYGDGEGLGVFAEGWGWSGEPFQALRFKGEPE